jgi:hypothetical protein
MQVFHDICSDTLSHSLTDFHSQSFQDGFCPFFFHFLSQSFYNSYVSSFVFFLLSFSFSYQRVTTQKKRFLLLDVNVFAKHNQWKSSFDSDLSCCANSDSMSLISGKIIQFNGPSFGELFSARWWKSYYQVQVYVEN